MIITRQTKVKLILSRMMEKVDLKSGEVIAKEAAFHYKTEVNLESTNSNELLSKTKETVFESLAKFNDKEVIGDSIQFRVRILTRYSMSYLVIPLIFCFQRFSPQKKR